MKKLIFILTVFLHLSLLSNAQTYTAERFKVSTPAPDFDFGYYLGLANFGNSAGVGLYINNIEKMRIDQSLIRLLQQVDVSGNMNISGAVNISANLNVTGTTTSNNLNITGNADFKELRLGSHIATRQTDAGRIAYQKFSDALDIVGAGTTATNRKIKFYNEGGAIFTGNVIMGNSTSSSARLKVKDEDPSAKFGITANFARQGTGDVGISLTQEGSNPNSYGIVNLAGVAGNTTGGIAFYNGRNPSNAGRLDMMIDGDGTVLIGSNKAKFQGARAVASRDSFSVWIEKGVIAADYAIENPTSWSDYVFASDYKLRSLKEVSNFIQANKHLPEVPSENEIKKTGYTLHDMNTILLKKIEELTLYMIEQEKKIEKLEQDKTENDGLRAEIAEINKKLLSLKIN